MSGRVCGEWLPQIKRNSCQNVNIVLLVDKHATYTLWDLKQVSGLFFFSLPATSLAMCSH